MAQDMKKDILLHTIAKLIVRLKETTSNLQALRTMLLLLVMMVGTTTAWGQDPDYSGTYYIANNSSNNNRNYQGYDNASNFYLCPAQEYYDDGTIVTTLNYNDTPFLTTYQTRQTEESLWIVEKVENTNYYTFKQKFGDNDYRYLTVNDAIESLGNNKTHRRRVHLEQITEITDRNYFIIESIETVDRMNSYAICCLNNYKSGDNKYLNPPGGNSNQYTASNNDSGGIIGFFLKINNNKIETGSQWFFEVPKPIIHIDVNNKLSFTCANEDVTFHYTIDNGEPSSTGTGDIYDASADIILTEGDHTIKVLAVMNSGNAGYASGVVEQEVTVFSTEHPYLISNNQSPWTVGSETKNVFYMIPSDVVSDNTTVNTTSMPRPTMEWNIRYTGEEQYLNIINAKTGGYLYRTNNSIYMKTSLEKTTLENANDNGFKFYLKKGTDGYNIVPYGTNNYLNKNGGNTDKNAVNLSGTDNVNSQWKFVTKDAVLNDDILPFTSSDANTSVYYKIQNGDDYSIIPPTTTNYATASNATDDATVKKMSWCFVKVKDPNDEDWLTYYKVVNAETGKALHYTGTTNTSLNVGTYDDGDDNYKFAFVKSPTTDYYYIVPKAVKDEQLAQISMIWRDNNALKKGQTRGVSGNIWTFTLADVFCNDPVFEEDAGSITISCIPDITRIYYTTDGTEPNPEDEAQRYTSTASLSASDQLCIKAIAVVSDGTNTASSAVITLLNKPDVTLAGGPYTYKGAEWKPSVTSVSIGETIAPTTPAATYTVAYENNINAGTASVNITDAEPTDAWYLWNVPETEFTIDRKAVTITATSASKLYNGTPLTESGFTSGALETGDTHTFTVAMTPGSTITNAGTQPNVIETVDGTAVTTGIETTVGNYLVTTVNGTLTVNRKAVIITANDASKEYDSTPLTEGGFTSGELETGDTHTFTVVMTPGSTITNAGTQPNVIGTVDGTAVTTGTETTVGNYLVTTVNGMLTVSQKSIGNGSLAEGFTIDFDASDDVILKYGTYTLTEDDYTISTTQENARYASRSISGSNNYTGNVAFRNAIAHFTTDANQEEWSATFVAENPGTTIGHALPEGISAYIISAINGNRVNAERLDYIPAGVPVLLVAHEEKYGFIVTDANSASVTAITEAQTGYNKLKEVTEGPAHFETREIYVLYKNEFVLNKEGDLALGKVYMDNPNYGAASPSPARLFIDWANVADIKDIQKNRVLERTSDRWYTIGGRRLSGKPHAKGLYILNGKKTIVK